MYIDTVIIAGILIVVVTCVFLGYCVKYMLKHMKDDGRKESEEKTKK